MQPRQPQQHSVARTLVRHRLFNRGAQKMLGYSAEEMIGTLPDRLHIEAEVLARGEELSALFGRRIAGLDVFVAIARKHGYEVRDWTYVRRDGTQLLVSLAITAVRDASGTLSGFLGIAIDQTQRLRAAELDIARERAEAASHAKSEFLSRVSHELRTPMNAILGYAQLIALDRERSLDTVQRERVLRIETAGWHLVKLIDDVLDLSRIESGRVQLSVETVDVGTVLAEAVRLLAPQASEREVSVALSGSMAPPASLVLGDRILGATNLSPERQRAEVDAIRRRTNRPFGLNHLLCFLADDRYATSLEVRPKVISTAWAWSPPTSKAPASAWSSPSAWWS